MPDTEQTMIRTQIYLPEDLRRYAAQLGDGTLAEGVRRALEQAKDQTNEE